MTDQKSSLEVADDRAASVAQTERRITVDDMKRRIVNTEYLNPNSCPHMTLCIVTLETGFTLVGKSAPADPANFDKDLGRQFAYEDVIRQMWPLEGYLLANYIWEGRV